MGMQIITGYTSTPHVTSEQARNENAGTIGTGKYVFDLGDKFQYELISNNIIRIKNGYGINQGTAFGITINDYEELTIDNGLVGVSRHDLVVARYEKAIETGIENVSLVIVKGTSSETPVDPDVEVGDILSGAVIDDFPLWRITINGLSVSSVEQLFSVSVNIQDISSDLNELITDINNEKAITDTILIGDSYAHDGTITPNWHDYLETYNGNLGTVYKSGIAGACFTGGSIGTLTKFIDMLTTIEATVGNNSNIKNIIVAGGFNDRGVATDTILSYIEAFATYAKTTFPNAKIYLGMIGHTRDYTTTDLGEVGGYIYNLRTVLPAYSKCSKFGINFLTGCENVMHKYSFFQEDLVHPNSDGSQAIAIAINNCLTSGNCTFSDYGEATGMTASGITATVTNQTLFNYQINGIVCYQIHGTFVFTSTTNLVANTVYELATITGGYGGGTIHFAHHVFTALQTNTGFMFANIYMEQSKLKMLVYSNTNSITQVSIPKMLLQFDVTKF